MANCDDTTTNASITSIFHQGKTHIEKYLLPTGLAVVAVERHEWLNAVVEGTGPAFVSVESSRTDYLLLTQAGATKLLCKGISTDNIMDILPCIVGFYELKTPNAIKKEMPNCRRQAILEFMDGNKMCCVKGWSSPICRVAMVL